MNKTKIIAEVSSNFQSEKDLFESIHVAKKCGANFVKFQALNADRLVNKKRNRKHWEQIRRYEIDPSIYPDLIAQNNVFFSVFDVDTVLQLEQLNVPYLKIASPDAVYEKLVKSVANTDIPAIISVGGCTLDEIRKTVGWYREFNSTDNLTLLYCVAAYPASCAYLGNLRDRINGSYSIRWGYSSHSTSCFIPALATALKATMCEVHFKLRDMKTPDNGHSLNPEQFKKMVDLVRWTEDQMDAQECPLECERETMRVARRKSDGLR